MAEQNPGGFVVTDQTDEGTTTVIVTGEGASSYPCPGGITEDQVLD